MRVTTGLDAAPRAEPMGLGGGARVVCVGFAAGLLGFLLFHQGTLFLLHHLGRSFPAALALFGQVPAPFGAMPVLLLAPRGPVAAALGSGFLGAGLAAALLRRRPLPALLLGALFGAVAATLLDALLAAAAPGLPALAGGDRRAWLSGGLANAAWGWGTALLLLVVRLPGRR